jgi:hypothetical protein
VIKNFEEVRKRLAELSDLLNKFKSEQVQLRILERIFAGGFDDTSDEGSGAQSSPVRRKTGRKRAAPSDDGGSGGKKKSAPRSRGTGPGPTLEQLIADGFFSKPRTLREIVDHSRTALARTIKQSDMSGPLARFVRDRKLSRSKNAEGQFAYKK